MNIVLDRDEREYHEIETLQEVKDFFVDYAKDGEYIFEQMQDLFSVFKGEELVVNFELNISIKEKKG